MAETTVVATTSKFRVWKLALPVMFEMLLHTCVWIFDTAMVGRLGADALSAVGLGGQIYWSVLFTFGALGIGTTALVARFIGAKDHVLARTASAHALMLAAGVAMIMVTVGWLCIPYLYRLADLGMSVSAMGSAYTRTVWFGAPFSLIMVVMSAIFRASGDTKTPLIAAGAMNISNIILDYGLIFGRLGLPELGVQGAAYASLVAQGVGMIVLAAFFINRDIKPQLSDFYPVKLPMCGRLIRISVPAGLETVLLDGARALNLFVITALGTVSFAAFQVTLAAESLSFMPGYAFAITASILTGQHLGTGNIAGVKTDIRSCLVMALSLMGVCGILFLALPHLFVLLFTPDEAVRGVAARCLRIAALMQPAIAIAEVYRGVLRGAGDTVTPLRITSVGSWAIRVPLTIIAIRVLGWGLEAVFWIMVCEWWVRAILTYYYYRKGNWANVKV